MRKKMIILAMISCIMAGSSLFAQSAAEKEVAARVETLRKAMIAADKLMLADLTAGELSYGHSSGLVEDKAAFIDEFLTQKSVFVSINLSDQTIKISGDIALVRHHLTAETNNKNVPGKADLYVLLVWQKQKGQWKLLARQAVKVPVP